MFSVVQCGRDASHLSRASLLLVESMDPTAVLRASCAAETETGRGGTGGVKVGKRECEVNRANRG